MLNYLFMKELLEKYDVLAEKEKELRNLYLMETKDIEKFSELCQKWWNVWIIQKFLLKEFDKCFYDRNNIDFTIRLLELAEKYQ